MTDLGVAPAVTVNLPALTPEAREHANSLVRHGATGAEEDTGAIIKAPCLVRAGGELVAVVLRLPPGPLAWARKSLLAWPFDTSTVRAAGIRTNSRTFGYLARKSLLQRDGCRACEGSRKAPDAHRGIVSQASVLSAMFAEAAPTEAARDQAAAEAVNAQWRMAGSQWTSGIANSTSVLPYHYDRNNLEPVWSAMIVVRRGVRGGYLHVPELGASFHCRDGDVVYFPGWRFVHGVTPVKMIEPDGYRITAVYYCVSQMRECGEPAEEMARAQLFRTTREADLREPEDRIGGFLERYDAAKASMELCACGHSASLHRTGALARRGVAGHCGKPYCTCQAWTAPE
jgi:hypothetical protein